MQGKENTGEKKELRRECKRNKRNARHNKERESLGMVKQIRRRGGKGSDDCAAQEQALRTNYDKYIKSVSSSLCRMC